MDDDIDEVVQVSFFTKNAAIRVTEQPIAVPVRLTRYARARARRRRRPLARTLVCTRDLFLPRSSSTPRNCRARAPPSLARWLRAVLTRHACADRSRARARRVPLTTAQFWLVGNH